MTTTRKLTDAQQSILDGIDFEGGIHRIPSYSIGRKRSAEILARKGLITIDRNEGHYIVRRTGKEIKK